MPALKFMNFNIRTELADDGPDNWVHRRKLVFDSIRDNDPDFLGIEEPTDGQWAELEEALGVQWTGIAHSRRDSVGKEPHLQGLFYKRARIRPVENGVFWLSDTPGVPGSITYPQHWGARTAVWVRTLDIEAKRELIFAVTHLDTHPDSWLPCAKTLAAELNRRAANLPVVLTGDFNCAAGSDPWKYLTGAGGFRDAWTDTGKPDEGVTTFNAFKPVTRLPLEDQPALEKWMHDTCDPVPAFSHYPAHVLKHRNYRIDWILHRGPFETKDAVVDVRTFGGRTSSDHYPVLASLNWL